MARKKYEFRPDKTGPDLLNKLYLTKKQRLSLLKWTLFSLVLLALSLLQDVILCHLNIFGASTDLLPCAIFVAGILLGAEDGGVFSLCGAAFYQLSGSGPGYYVIALIPVLTVLLALFRQSYLQKGFAASMLCTAAATLGYAFCIFLIGLFLEKTTGSRFVSHMLSALYTLVAAPVLYPVVTGINSIGGEAWKE